MLSVTTDSVPSRDRTEFWADLVSRHVTPIRIEPAGDQALRGEIEARVIGEVGVAQVSGRGVRAVHTGAHIGRATSHLYAACVHVDGEASITRKGGTIALQRGDIFITDSRQEFTLDLERPWRHLLITIPTRWLDARAARPESLAGAVSRDRPLAHLWASHLAAGFALAGDFSATAATLFARHSVELLAQLLDESPGDNRTAAGAARAAIFVSACQIIALKSGDPRLMPTAIARELGVSSRTLARAFAERNETVMRRVFDERVRRAAELLASPRSAHRSITDIAFACGFNDLSHFGRVFAGKMHMTPSQWRRRAQ